MQLWMFISVVGSMLLSLLFVNLAVYFLIMRIRDLLQADPFLSESIDKQLQQQGVGLAMLKEKLLTPSAYASLLPQIEKHVDLFLNVKLKEQMPVVGMMVGDRTIAQMKGIFLKELELLFPEVMEGYLSNMEKDAALRHQITTRVTSLASGIFVEYSARELKRSALKMNAIAIVAGLIIGLCNLGVYFLLKS